MATYVNDLRLKEIATGDESGTWGTSTNTNLELIGEAFSFGTEAITTNADTHTTTIADGSTDPGRSMYLKYTGTLDSACTITIGPNTVSKMWFIENGTSGSQNIIISQGSGANITIPPGDVKVIYSDGAGSGAAVVDAFASLSVVDLKVQDDLTVTDDMTVGGTLGVTGIVTLTDDLIIGDGKTIGSASDVDAMTIAANGQVTFTQTLIGTALDISGDIDVDGTTNLDVVDIDGAVDMASTLAVGGVITANAGVVVDNITIDGQEIDVSSGDLTLDVAGDIKLDSANGYIKLLDGGTEYGYIYESSNRLVIQSMVSDGDLLFSGVDGGTGFTALTLDMSDAGTAIFNNKVGIGGSPSENLSIIGSANTGMNIQAGTSHLAFIDFGDSGDTNFGGINYNNADDTLNLRAGNANRFTINSSGNSLFTGTVTANAGVVVDNITIDGNEIDVGSGNMTLDSAGAINIDAGDGESIFKAAGTTFAMIKNSSGDVLFSAEQQDKDISFKGNDGGSAITALTLDMSAAGAATFNSSVTTGGEVSIASSDGTAKLRLTSQGTGSEVFTINGQIPGVANGGFAIRNETDSRNDFFIDAAGAATFGGGITATSAAINGQLNVTGTTNSNNIVANQVTTQFDTSSFMRFHPAATTNSGGYTNIFFGTDTNNNFGVAMGGLRDGTSGEPAFTLRMLNDSITGSLALKINNAGGFVTTPVAGGHAVFNENGIDADFRVESDGSAYMFFVDGGDNKVKIGTSSTLYSGGETMSVQCGSSQGIGLATTGASSQLLGLYNSADSGTRYFVRFASSSAGSEVGKITSDGSSTTYATSSDARLKNVTGEARGLEVINELNPVAYNWKADGKSDEGLIAQEVQKIVPNAVVEGEEDEMYCMDYSKLVVHLVAGMKEQQTQIDALQSEINLLKGV